MVVLKKLFQRYVSSDKGAALLSVFIVIMVVLTLGMGLMALTVGSTQQATKTDSFEKGYYAAEGGTQQATEYVKKSITDIYKNIKADVQSFGVTTAKNNYDYFFDELNNKAATFTRNVPDTSAQAGITDLTVVINDLTKSGDTRTYSVLASAKVGSTTVRNVEARLTVHFAKVEIKSVTFRDEALITLGTFTEKSGANGMTVTGDMLAGAYNMQEYTITGTQKLLSDYPEANNDALTWHIDYAKRLSENPKKTSGFTTTITSTGTVGGDLFGWKKPLDTSFPMRITGTVDTTIASNMNDYLKDVTKNLQIDTTKNLTVEANVSGTSSNYVKIYCDGNLTLQGGGVFNYVEIYCGGNVALSQSCSNVKVNCSGDLTISGGANMTGTNMLYSGGNVSFYSTTISGTLVLYAEKTFTVFGSGNIGSKKNPVQGIIYTNGSFNPGSMTLNFEGQIAAKSSITVDNGTFSFKSNPTLVNSLEADSFVTSGTVKTVKVPAMSAILTSTTINEP